MTQNPASYTKVAAFAAVAIAAGLFSRTVWPVRADAVGANPASNVTVACAPDQQALVEQVPVNGRLQTAVRCVGTTAMYGASDVIGPYGQSPLRPAVYSSPAAPEFAPARVEAPRPVAVRAPVKKRSWQRTALVIGGSTGAGAGIGAIAGGKKGALIGAAIGGGAATLFEAIKR